MNRIRVLAGIGATIALGVLAHRIGLSNIAAQVQHLGVALPVVMLAGLIRLYLQTRAWSIALRAEDIEVPQQRLIAIRLASQAAGYLTVLGAVVSEPVKLLLLRNPGGAAAAAPATLAETGAYWFTTVLLGLAGACAGAFLIANSPAVWVAVVLFGLALIPLATKRSLLPLLVGAAGPRAPRWLRSAAAAELDIRSFRSRHRSPFAQVLLLDALAQIVTLAEVAGVLWAVGIHISLPRVLVIEAAGRMVKILAAWIPGRIGADEGGAAASFALLGIAPAAGLMLTLARRVRDLLWCVVGIVWAAHSGAREPAEIPGLQHASVCLGEN